MATYDTSEWSIYGERDLSIMDFWRDKYDKANALVSWSYRDDKKFVFRRFAQQCDGE